MPMLKQTATVLLMSCGEAYGVTGVEPPEAYLSLKSKLEYPTGIVAAEFINQTYVNRFIEIADLLRSEDISQRKEMDPDAFSDLQGLLNEFLEENRPKLENLPGENVGYKMCLIGEFILKHIRLVTGWAGYTSDRKNTLKEVTPRCVLVYLITCFLDQIQCDPQISTKFKDLKEEGCKTEDARSKITWYVHEARVGAPYGPYNLTDLVNKEILSVDEQTLIKEQTKRLGCIVYFGFPMM